MISLYDIIEASSGQLYGEPGAQIFTEFCISPSLVPPNSLFVTLKNDQGDSHRYIEEVIAAGASGVICTRPPDCDTSGISVILVRDTVETLMVWSRKILARYGTKVVAVTGSSGKSVAVEAIAQVLATRYVVLASPPDAIDYRLCVPLALAHLKAEHQVVVLRLGSGQPGEMSAMIQAAQPHVGVVLTVDYTHSSRFESIEQIVQEYQRLIEYLPPMGLAVLNYDDDRVRLLASATRSRSVSFGIESFGANLIAYNVIIGADGTGFDLRSGSERFVGRWLPLIGKHQLYNVLAALSVGQFFEVSIEEGLRALIEVPPLPGRMNTLIGRHNAIVIDDTHSATPQSTLAALDWLASARDPQQRVIFVFGDLDDPGDLSQVAHRQIGQRAAEQTDVLVTIGTEAAAAARAALDYGMPARQLFATFNIPDAIQVLLNRVELSGDDLVLVKGGASMRMEEIVAALLNQPQDRAQLVRQTHEMRAILPVESLRPVRVEIDTAALAGNIRALRTMLAPNVALMAVVKADGYGHGAVMTARIALMNGAEYLAVANLQEALELRDAGIEAPILVLGYTPIYGVRDALRHQLTITLYDLELARAFDRAAREIGGKLKTHVKLDTGMGRLGVLPADAVQMFRHLSNLPYIEVEGVYTHFANADEDPEATAEQLASFRSVLRPLRAAGMQFKYIHAANSAATLSLYDSHFNMVRCGLVMYGLSPSASLQLPDEFRPVMMWKTVVAQVKTLPPGHPVGYGSTYRTSREETIAILPVGYADGLRRTPHQADVLVHGVRAPIIGRISMEKTVINVSHIPGAAPGDEVVLLGWQGDAIITAEEIAAHLGTINYEVVTTILARVPRR